MDVARFVMVVLIANTCFADCQTARKQLMEAQKSQPAPMVSLLLSDHFPALCKADQNRINQIVTSTMKIRLQDSQGKDIANTELVATVVERKFLLTTVPIDSEIRTSYAQSLESHQAKISIYNYLGTKIVMPVSGFKVGNLRGHRSLVLIFSDPILFEEKPNLGIRFLRVLTNQNYPRTIRKIDIRFEQALTKLANEKTSAVSDTLLVNYHRNTNSYDSLKIGKIISSSQKVASVDDLSNTDVGGAVYNESFELVGLNYENTDEGPVFDGIPSSLQTIGNPQI